MIHPCRLTQCLGEKLLDSTSRGWDHETRRVWSLYDLVRYAVRDLYALLQWAEHTINFTRSQDSVRAGEAALLSSAERITINNQVTCLRKHCREMELPDTVVACDGLIRSLNVVPFKETRSTCTLGECRGQLLSIRRMLIAALQNRLFMYIPVHLGRYVNKSQQPTVITSQLGMYGVEETSNETMHTTPEWFNPNAPVKPFGDKVFDTFEGARYDAEHAALCIATGASTAAIFHLMRVVEHGVRSLGKNLGLSRIKETTYVKPKKPGAPCPTCGRPDNAPGRKITKTTPIENCVWEKIEGQLRSKIDAKLRALRPGHARDEKQSFYHAALADFHGFKDAWRNHVMHSRGEFGETEAFQVLGHVDRFMRALGEHAK